MILSAKAEYACLAIIDLVQNQPTSTGPIQIKDICKRKNIPYKYLTQILPQLKSIGIVRSIRGTTGGYLLSTDPGQLTVLKVVEAVDGPIEIGRLAKGPQLLPADPRSVLTDTWQKAIGRARDELGRQTFKDLIDKLQPGPPNYNI